MQKTPLVVLGALGQLPYAGVAWQVLHYLEGFRRLGFDAYYIEDTGSWPYDAEKETVTDDCTFPVDYIRRQLAWCGMEDKWAYRSGVDGRIYGLSDSRVNELMQDAAALVNLTGATLLRQEHLEVPIRIYLETDPVLPQIEIAQGRSFTIDLLEAHTHHFSYGENFGAPDCRVPIQQFHYEPTRQPVVLDWWSGTQDARRASQPACFTTIANWQQSEKDLEWEGETYSWSKHHEFLKVLDLPSRIQECLQLALACGDPQAIALLTSKGWRVTDAIALSRDILTYRSFIQESRGEFTVAKDQNVRLRSGWFSDRSACYLASGRPVITQDTGFGNIMPTGRGLFAFRTIEDVIGAMETIRTSYVEQCQAASEIAREYFAAEKVIGSLIERAGIG